MKDFNAEARRRGEKAKRRNREAKETAAFALWTWRSAEETELAEKSNYRLKWLFSAFC
jgi:hypothetical protein